MALQFETGVSVNSPAFRIGDAVVLDDNSLSRRGRIIEVFPRAISLSKYRVRWDGSDPNRPPCREIFREDELKSIEQHVKEGPCA